MLTGKEKRYLRGIANTRNALFQVGKGGVSSNMIATISDSLEAHELVKVNILKTCSAEVKEIALDISAGTRSEIVQIVGRTIVFYRRSKKNLLEM